MEQSSSSSSKPRDFRSIYKLKKLLGEGTFGVVRLGEHIKTKEQFAVKILKKLKMTDKDKSELEREVDLLISLDHPNVVKLSKFYQDSEHYYIVMELLNGGELFDVIVERDHFDEQQAKDVILPIIDALQYCHNLGIVHRDLKPENILFSHKNYDQATIKICDFGLARTLNDHAMATTTCGTPAYVAPEVLYQKGYGTECDVWSLGVVLFILLSGYPPFYDEDDFKLFDLIKKGQFGFYDQVWDSVSTDAKDLIQKLLIVDPKKRITLDNVLQHPWLKKSEKKDFNSKDMLKKMREWNSQRKIKVTQTIE